MIAKIKHLWINHKLLLSAFALAVAVTLFFSARSVLFFIYWSDPSHRNQALEPWMTPRYIAKSYDIPVETIAALLGVVPGPKERPTLARIAARDEMTVEMLITVLTIEIEALKAAQE